MAKFDPNETLIHVCEVMGCQATAIEPVERAKYLMAEINRLQNAMKDVKKQCLYPRCDCYYTFNEALLHSFRCPHKDRRI